VDRLCLGLESEIFRGGGYLTFVFLAQDSLCPELVASAVGVDSRLGIKYHVMGLGYYSMQITHFPLQ